MPELPSAPYINNEADLGKVMHHIRTKCYEPLKLHEFFLCDVNKVMKEFSSACSSLDASEVAHYKAFFES